MEEKVIQGKERQGKKMGVTRQRTSSTGGNAIVENKEKRKDKQKPHGRREMVVIGRVEG